MEFSNFIILFGTGVILLTLLIALVKFKKDKPKYFKYIFIYILIGLIISSNKIIKKNNISFFKSNSAYAIEQVLSIFQTFMLYLFFINVLNKSKYYNILLILIPISIIIQLFILNLVIKKNADVMPSIASNSFLIIFCFFYLRDLMSNNPTLILLKSTTFCIFIGILYCSCISLPIFSLISFITRDEEYKYLRSQIFSIANMSIIVLYLFIIKSYLCLKPPQNL